MKNFKKIAVVFVLCAVWLSCIAKDENNISKDVKKDTTRTKIMVEEDKSGIWCSTEFKIGERVNKVNTKLWGVVSAIRGGMMTEACYYVEFENGDQYWVQEELLCGEKKKYLLEINVR